MSRTTRATSRITSGVALAFALLALAPVAAAAATIDFEDRPNGDTVNSDYSSQGVTFNGPVASNYGPGFAHSGTKAIKGCTIDPEGCSFANPPPRIRADFTTGQTSVGVWVGNQDATNPKTVRLTAFDANNNEVGHQDVTMPASTPVNNHLTVTAGGATIRALEVSGVAPTGIFDLVVDDVEFSTAGPPPPCTASGPPVVNLTSPADNTYLQNDSVLLKGNVLPRGAPLTAATVVSEGSTTRTAIGFPSPIGEIGGSFAINMAGLLQPGNQKIYVTATNCAGTGVSGNPIVTYNPLPAGAGFEQLAPVEIVQTVQSPYNPTPMIAGGPNGTKRTIARVQLTATGTATAITGVSGRLTATRLDGSRPGGPLAVDSLNTISVEPGQSLQSARAALDTSLNFELPPEWVTEGRLHLQLERLKIEGAQTVRPCVNCDNFGGIQSAVTFHRVPPLRVFLISVPYTGEINGVSQTISPRQKDVDFLASWLRRAYPASDVQITQAQFPLQARLPGDCHDLNDDISTWASTMGQPAETRFYGIVSDAGGFMRGCADIGGTVASGPSGSNNWGWDNDGTYNDWYGGHELAHTFNRLHPDGGCKDSDDDDGFPYSGGLIGGPQGDNIGVDVGDATLNPVAPFAVNNWLANWHDVMTYCENQWLSSYTYNGILRDLCGSDKPNCPNHQALTKARRAKKGGPRLAINGTMNLENGGVDLQPMAALKGLTLTERPKKSAYAIELVGAGGKTIASYPFEPKEISDLPEGQRLASVKEIVPFKAKAARIEIVKGNRTIASRDVSDHAPTVKLRALKGKQLTAPVKLRWSSRDADGDKRTSTVQYAADGKHYETLAAGLKKGKLKVDPDTLGGGDEARFRVIVTDGVLTGIDKSKPVKVAAKAPKIAIATPVDGATLTEGQSLQLVATVQDDQDARLGDEVVWSSDVQGELGRGAALATTLRPGAHKLTASVTNSFGLNATATVNVTVETIPPTVQAQLVP